MANQCEGLSLLTPATFGETARREQCLHNKKKNSRTIQHVRKARMYNESSKAADALVHS